MSACKKYEAVKRQLEGLEVDYDRHFHNDASPTHARVNGFSIIWHWGAFADEGQVEVRLPGGEIRSYVPISKLRKLLETVERGQA